jgi:hypothetical protein
MVQSVRHAIQSNFRQAILPRSAALSNKTASSPQAKPFVSALGNALATAAGQATTAGSPNWAQLSANVGIANSLAARAALAPTQPVDPRDGAPVATGQVTASGAPLITPSATPIQNQWGYTGAAATNPYFTTPSNPLESGYVTGFANWFSPINVTGTSNASGGGSYTMNGSYGTTQEGAQEALRLVQTYAPGATIVSNRFGSQGGPYQADAACNEIQLPNGRQINAGLILNAYYNGGQGVTAMSDQRLQLDVQQSG